MRIARVFVAVAVVLGFCAIANADTLVDQTGTPWGAGIGPVILVDRHDLGHARAGHPGPVDYWPRWHVGLCLEKTEIEL